MIDPTGHEVHCGVQCDECGEWFEPTTDTYTCPYCGTADNYPDRDDDY